MRGKKDSSEVMPPALALPPAMQNMSVKEASACADESALVALESLTNSTAPLRPTCSMRWARPGKLFNPRSISAGASPECQQAADAKAAFCALLRPHREPAPGTTPSEP